MNCDRFHEEQLKQLTGCRYSALVLLEKILNKIIRRNKVGRPFKYSTRTMLIVTLIKLRGESAYRTLEIFLGIHWVTLHRYTNRICELLAGIELFKPTDHCYLIVDGTCSRVRSSEQANYSGYKHHKNRKIQMIVDDRRRVMAVSQCYDGAVHDKRIWNKEFNAIKPLFDRIVLADKGYAGGTGDNEILFRPIKRNELEYKTNKEHSKAFNRALSKECVVVELVQALRRHLQAPSPVIKGILWTKKNL